MTPEQEQALIDVAVAGLTGALEGAFERLVQLIRDGVPPREAAQQVMDSFAGVMAETLSTALSGIIGAAVGSTAAMAIEVGPISLSAKLYAQSVATSEVVAGVVQRHTAGFQDARKLALELFEGYAFRAPDAEVLQIAPGNPRLPRYLREALLSDAGLAGDLKRAYARIQADNLSTPALRAAYSELLAALDELEAGKGAKLLEKRLETAFFERVRYFAQRIAQTELHRAYAQREARLLMEDADVEFVQVRRLPGQSGPCICDLYAGRDQWGMGRGVYPKAKVPVPPYHPFCRCVMSPRLDLTGRRAGQLDEGADVYFLRRLDPSIAGRIVGSRDKLDRVMSGAATVPGVVNAGKDPVYWTQTAGQVAGV